MNEERSSSASAVVGLQSSSGPLKFARPTTEKLRNMKVQQVRTWALPMLSALCVSLAAASSSTLAAAEQTPAEKAQRAAVMPPQRGSEDVKRLREAAEFGDAQAQYDLGGRYAAGDGVAQSDAAAFEWQLKA